MEITPDSPQASPPVDDQGVRKVELLISHLLRIGVIASLLVIGSGTVISFVHHPYYINSANDLARLTTPGAAFPRTPREVLDGLQQFRGQAIVVLGLFLLVATPVMRVAVSIFAFIYQRDFIFVAITSIVLALLLLSFALGKAE